MRKLVIICITILFVAACSSRKKIIANTETFTISEEKRTEGRNVMGKDNCFTCHKFTGELIGPSFAKIANRYSANSIPALVKKIREGGKGAWGDLYMVPHSDLSDADAIVMVKYILSLKN